MRVRKAVVSVTASRDAQDAIIGYLLICTDDTARKRVEAEQEKLDQEKNSGATSGATDLPVNVPAPRPPSSCPAAAVLKR